MLTEEQKTFEKTTEFQETIKRGLQALGKKNLALIAHGVSFPSAIDENTGFGTYNGDGGHALIDFASGIFNAIQLGPNGKTKVSDSSPYTGTIILLKVSSLKSFSHFFVVNSFKSINKGF